jgi:2-C-methyl-D-erythritol 4-phosphate cytidylyltransferase
VSVCIPGIIGSGSSATGAAAGGCTVPAPLTLRDVHATLKQILGLVPAAGVGARMGADRPKQYLRLAGRSLLEHAVRCLLADARVTRVLVVVAPGDPHIGGLALPARCIACAGGGATRAATVRNGLALLRSEFGAGDDDGVLVHDAARPCLGRAELGALIDAGSEAPGALLALPVGDTLKRAAGDRVLETVAREQMWRAQTPQFFGLALLERALAQEAGERFTDESSAVEGLGLRPRLVTGSSANLKVTTAADLALAEAILRCAGAD